MIDTIVVAAAGRGTRMEHLTQDKPKHLVTVAGKPFFHFVLESIRQQNFKQIIVVGGYHIEQLRVFLEKQPEDIILVDQFAYSTERYGTAVVVEAAREYVEGKPFVFVNGDGLYTSESLAAARVEDGYHHIVGMHHKDAHRYGVMESEDGFLVRFSERPKQPVCDVVNIGVYGFGADIFETIDRIQLSPRGEYEIVDAFNMLADERKVKVDIQYGDWAGLNEPNDIPYVEEFIHKYLLN